MRTFSVVLSDGRSMQVVGLYRGDAIDHLKREGIVVAGDTITINDTVVVVE